MYVLEAAFSAYIRYNNLGPTIWLLEFLLRSSVSYPLVLSSSLSFSLAWRWRLGAYYHYTTAQALLSSATLCNNFDGKQELEHVDNRQLDYLYQRAAWR